MFYFTAAFIFWTGALCASHENLASSSSETRVPTSSGGTDYHQTKNKDHQGMLPVARYFGRKVEKHKSQEMQIKSQSISSGPKNLQSIRTRKE